MATIEHYPSPTDQAPTAGWHPDPDGYHKLRYFDGDEWTNHVTHYGPTPCTGCGRGEDQADPGRRPLDRQESN